MTVFVLIVDGVVVQKQPYFEEGFIEAPDDTVPGMLVDGDSYASPSPTQNDTQVRPSLFATLGVTITDSAISSVEMAAQLQGAYYEQGYLQIGFGASRIPPNYLVFVQCDVPATMTQYKSEDGFELVFANGDGDPVDPGRLDIQILEVR